MKDDLLKRAEEKLQAAMSRPELIYYCDACAEEKAWGKLGEKLRTIAQCSYCKETTECSFMDRRLAGVFGSLRWKAQKH